MKNGDPVDGLSTMSQQELLQAYLDALPIQAFVKGLDGTYIYGNPTFAKAHYMSSEELQQKGHEGGDSGKRITDADLYDITAVHHLALEDQKVLQTGKAVRSQVSMSSMKTLKFPVKNSEGTIVAIGGLTEAVVAPPVHETIDPSLSSTRSLIVDDIPVGNLSYPLRETNSQWKQPMPGDNRQETDKQELSACHDGPRMDEPPLSFTRKRAATNGLPHQLHHVTSCNSMVSYQGLFANMQTGVALNEIVTDADSVPIDFIFREVNPAFVALTGLKETDIIGKRATDVLPGVADEEWVSAFGKVALEGTTWRFDRKYSKYDHKWYGGMAYQPSGQERRFVSLFYDVSENVEAEEALRESEERHRNLFESMMQGVVYHEASGKIIAANPSAERILGLTIDQMEGRTSVDPRWKSVREDGSDFPGNEHPTMVALQSGKPVTGVFMGVFHPNTNKRHWIIIDAIPRFRPGENKPYQAYSTFTDMTQTKEFERKVLEEKERAEMADKLKSAFLANMSHEIRTPLNGIIGHIDLALSNELVQEYQEENLEGLHVARQSGELLISIIQDILDLSKIEAGQMDINNDEHFELRSLGEQVASLGQTMINQRGKTISFETQVAEVITNNICGDPFRLQQVLNNLVSNAIKFTDRGKVALSLKLHHDKNMIEFRVRDTGKGIPKSHLESIFEPFRQVEIGDTRKHGGTGLGLTISKKLVEMMGGELTLTSSVEGPDKGSCFSFTFPYKQYTPPKGSKAEGSNSSTLTKGRARFHNTVIEGRILVAEDETVSRRLVNRMLGISGYEVILAEDGRQAVEKFKSHDDIALILMDVQMPNMDGLEATILIRKLEALIPGRDPIPIIALSAGAMKGDNERGLAVGMTDYLTKPVNFKLLQETLRHHLGVRPAPTPK